MPSPIRLQIVTEAGSNAGLDQSLRAIDSSVQYATQRIGSSFDAMARRIETSLSGALSPLLSQLDQIEQRVAKITGVRVGGGFGTAAAASTPAIPDTSTRDRTRALNLSLADSTFRQQQLRALEEADAQVRGQARARELAQQFINSNGFKLSGTQITGANGNLSRTLSFKNAAGGTARLDESTGRLTASIPEQERQWRGFGQVISDSFSTAHKGVVAFAAGVYALEQVGHFLKSAIIDPFKDFAESIQEATENSRKFEISLTGILGGAGRARELNRALVGASIGSPYTVSQLRSGAETLAFSPFLAGSLGGSTDSVVKETQRFSSLSSRLGLIDPVQGSAGATVSLRDLAQGGGGDAFRSLRRRFGLSEAVLARLVNRKPEELAADNNIGFEAVEKFANLFLPQSAVEQSSKLISVRLEKLRDTYTFALAKIGDSGVFDSVSAKLGKFTESIFEYFKSGQFDKEAGKISTDLDRILGNIGKAVDAFFRKFTGAGEGETTIASATSGLVSVFDRLAAASDNLVPVAKSLGSAAGEIAGQVGKLVDSLNTIAEALRDPEEFAKKFGKSAVRGIGEAGVEAVGGFGKWLIAPDSYTQARDQFARSVMGQDANLATRKSGADRVSSYIDRIKSREQADATQTSTIGTGKAIEFKPDDNTLGNRYLALIQGSTAQFSALDTAAQRSESPLEKLVSSAQASVSRGYGSKEEPFQYLNAYQYLDKEQRDAHRTKQIPFLGSGRSMGEFVIDANIETTKKALDANYIAAARNFGDALFETTKDLPPGAAAAMEEKILAGTTSYADRISKILTDAGRKLPEKGFGLASLAPDRQISVLQEYQANRLRSIGQYPKYGQFDVNKLISGSQNADQLYNSIGGLTPLSDRDTASLSAGELAKQKGDLREQLNKRFAQYQKAPEGAERDAAYINLSRVADALAENIAKTREAQRAVNYLKEAWIDFGGSVRQSIESSLGSAIDGLIWRTGSAKEVLLGFAHSITSAFSQMASKNLVQGLLGDLGTRNSAGNPNPASGIFGAVLGAFTHSGSAAPVQAAANGAVWPGFIPFHAYAEGGIATSKTLGLIAETGQPEAVIPLRGGKVPVDMRGGGGGEPPIINVSIVANHEELVKRGLLKNSHIVVDIANNSITKGGKLGKSMRRSPG